MERPDIGRLCLAMQRARLTLRYPRQQLTDMVKQYVGAHWSEESNIKSVPCNLIALYVDIVGRKLIATNPRVMLSADDRSAMPVVAAMEAWCNKEIVKTKLADTLQRCVLNGLFSIGICKVGLASPADAANAAWNLRAGDPFAASIDLDDFVFDIHCRDFASAAFIGHRYRAPLEAVRGWTKRKDLAVSNDPLFNLEGDERLNVLGRGYYGDQEEFEDMVDLWEVYLPRHRLVVTLLEDNLTGAGASATDRYYGKPLRVQKWIGPARGPYHILGLGGKVPGNPMPKGPIQDLYDLHLHLNTLMRKLMRQAERQKEVLPVRGQQKEDGDRAIQTNDGEAFLCDNEAPKPVSFGGPSQANFQLFSAFRDLYVWLAGNLNSLGGLSPEAKTLGQDKLLAESASATIGAMQDATTNFTSDVFEALCWWWYHHPEKVMSSRHAVQGLPDIAIQRHVYPAGQSQGAGGNKQMSRDMAFEDMNIQVDPYSMPKATPQEKLQALNQIVTTIYIPMAQQLQAQGVVLDTHEWLNLVSKFANMPEMKDILTMQEPVEQEGGLGAPEGGPKPAETTRNYVRHSQGNATQGGKELQAANAMGSWAKNGEA